MKYVVWTLTNLFPRLLLHYTDPMLGSLGEVNLHVVHRKSSTGNEVCIDW